MEKVPHVVLLDTGANWSEQDNINLERGYMQTFCNEPFLEDSASHGSNMLKILSRNLKGTVKVSMGKVIADANAGSPQSFARGLIWAAELYPDVVVLPLGLMKPNSSVKAALEILANTHCKIYAAVGNVERGQTESLYPAAYPECIAVGSTQQRQAYQQWATKPDLLIDETVVTNVKSMKNIQWGTSAATMLAVAEYLNDEFFISKSQYRTY